MYQVQELQVLFVLVEYVVDDLFFGVVYQIVVLVIFGEMYFGMEVVVVFQVQVVYVGMCEGWCEVVVYQYLVEELMLFVMIDFQVQ